MTRIDWIALAIIGLAALLGYRKGLIGSALSLVGVVLGAVVGSRVAPHLVHGGTGSRYTPLAMLAGAAIGAAVFHTAGSIAGSMLRSGLRLSPLKLLDSLIGLVLGAAAGVGLVWVLGAAALRVPGQPELRRSVQRSEILQRLNEIVPPSRLLKAFSRIDLFPSLAGPAARVKAPTAAVLAEPAVRSAEASVVRVVGSACGLDITGSGWVAAPGLVVTAAHVVAGERRTSVERAGSSARLPAVVIGVDRRNDLAVLRVRGLRAPALPLADPIPGEPVAILGFPEAGPLRATAARIGKTESVVSEDAYGKGPVLRTMTSLRGLVRHGNSGGPAVDAGGQVLATIFGSRTEDGAGLGVPGELVRHLLERAGGPVSTGACVS